MGLALVAISVGNHLLLALIFFAVDQMAIAVYQIVSSSFFAVLTWVMWRFRAIALVWSLSLIEFSVASSVAALMLGISAGFTTVALVAFGVLAPVRFGSIPARLAAYAIALSITVGSAVYANLAGPLKPLPPDVNNWMHLTFALMIAPTAAVVIWFFMKAMWRAESALEKEYARSEGLLHNIMPAEVATRLKEGEGLIADGHPQVTVLFADIVGFTERSARMSPERLVSLLNTVFSRFDALVEEHQVEKIKTIGDAYLAVSGLPSDRPDHADAIANLALDMLAACEDLNREMDKPAEGEPADPVQVRIGLHTGAVVAGIIGTSKFAYDLWGDVVNTASRMESSGAVGRIQVSDAVHALLKDRFRFTERGEIEVKGKGAMRTWFLDGAQA